MTNTATITKPSMLLTMIGDALESGQSRILKRKGLTFKEITHLCLYWNPHVKTIICALPDDETHGMSRLIRLTWHQVMDGFGDADWQKVPAKVTMELEKIGVLRFPGDRLDIRKQLELFEVGKKIKTKHAWE